MVMAFSPGLFPDWTSAASDFAESAKALRSASVIWDCVEHETASAIGVNKAMAAAINVLTELRMDGMAPISFLSPTGWELPTVTCARDNYRERNRTTASLYIHGAQMGTICDPVSSFSISGSLRWENSEYQISDLDLFRPGLRSPPAGCRPGFFPPLDCGIGPSHSSSPQSPLCWRLPPPMRSRSNTLKASLGLDRTPAKTPPRPPHIRPQSTSRIQSS